jgi:hypothetical protein
VQGRRIVEVIDTAPLATDEAEAAEWAAGNGARLDAAALARGALEVSGTAILLRVGALAPIHGTRGVFAGAGACPGKGAHSSAFGLGQRVLAGVAPTLFRAGRCISGIPVSDAPGTPGRRHSNRGVPGVSMRKACVAAALLLGMCAGPRRSSLEDRKCIKNVEMPFLAYPVSSR